MRKTLSIRLAPAELQTLTHAAAAAGVPLAAWLRATALKAAGGVSSEWRSRPPAPPAWAEGLLRAVRRTVRRELERRAKPSRGSRRARPPRA